MLNIFTITTFQICYFLFVVGASAPLIIAGASLAVSGGATGFGAGIADLKISNSKCREAQVLIDRDVELTMELLILEKVTTHGVPSTFDNFPQSGFHT